MADAAANGNPCHGRSPRGERGLKLKEQKKYMGNYMSLPPRGAWIEMRKFSDLFEHLQGRSPRGERGLKFTMRRRLLSITGRSPRGERGLKCKIKKWEANKMRVAPPAGSVD